MEIYCQDKEKPCTGTSISSWICNRQKLINILAIRSSERLENRVAKWLEHDSQTDIIEPGLGANDAPGATHLLRLRADDMAWMSLTDKAGTLLAENTLNQTNNIED